MSSSKTKTCFVVLIGLTALAARPQEESEVQKGRMLYRSLCQRCHGADGDDTSYPGIVPLVGAHLRLDKDEMVRVATRIVGRSFNEGEARSLYAYLDTLKGAKAFSQAELLFSPYLLERKLSTIRRYRIVDARPRADYDAGHIPNALPWSHPVEKLGCRLPGDEAPEVLGSLGVTPDTLVVIYDAVGGPQAACLWWALATAGHYRAAVLDGGWRRWLHEGGRASTTLAPIPATSYPMPSSDSAASQRCAADTEAGPRLNLDWHDLLGEEGFRSADEVVSVLEEAGFHGPGTHLVPGSPAEVAAAAFVLKLLGYESVELRAADGLLCVGVS